jgi:tRNA pseudouridine38-40 synthase
MAPRTIRLLIAYDGTGFRGWAAQRDRSIRTVEGALGDVLAGVLGEQPSLAVAGRTDAGVHARGQVASFRVERDVSLRRIQRAVNSRLGPEIVVIAAEHAPASFDARFSATARVYRYRVDVGDVPDPFTARYVWHHPCAPDLRAMRAAARLLMGEHDFTSFCRHPGAGRPTVRDLQRVSVSRSGDRLELGFRANAFLHQMVRALTGTLLAVGEGRIDPAQIPGILVARDRSAARQMAPAHGLTLERVVYGAGGRRRRRRPGGEL